MDPSEVATSSGQRKARVEALSSRILSMSIVNQLLITP